MKFLLPKFLALLWLVLIGLMLGSCKEESTLSGSNPGSLNYSTLDAAFTESKALLTEDLLSLVPGDIDLLQFRTYIEETELFLETKKAQTQEEIDYDDNFSLGIPIVAVADIPDEYILKMREVVNKLLRKRPDVRAAMVAQSYSMAMRIKESDFIPHRNFQTPQEITEHYTGMHDFCPLEEFLHAMQEIGIQKVDPEVSREIIDAYKAAIERGNVFDPYGTIGSEDEWPYLGMSAADFATEEARNRLYLSPKVVSSFVVTEYFGLCVCVWHGNLYPGEILLETRREFTEKDPALDEIIRRYFMEDDWQCTRQ